MVTGRDASRRQQAAKQKDFFKGNVKTASMKEIYDGSAQHVKDLADETGIIATDKASLAYTTKHKDKFVDPGRKNPTKEYDRDTLNKVFDDYEKSYWGGNMKFTPEELEMKGDLGGFNTPIAALDHAKGRYPSFQYRQITPEEKAVADSLLKYETQSYGWHGERMEKALGKLSKQEQELLKSYNQKVRLNKLIEDGVGASISEHQWSNASAKDFEDRWAFGRKFEAASTNVSSIGDKETIKDYAKRVVNDPNNKQYFDLKVPPKSPAVPLDKMIALSDTSANEKSYFNRRMNQDWDRINHSSFSGEIKNTFRIKNSDEVERRYADAAEQYGNIKRNLYHGTDHFAARNIAANGYIVPKSAKAGRMLGDGVYLADKTSKSAQYLGTRFSRNSGNGIIFVNDAAMGKVTSYGMSGTYNDPNTIFAKKGKMGIINNEWAVKDPNAVIPRYWLDVEVER